MAAIGRRTVKAFGLDATEPGAVTTRRHRQPPTSPVRSARSWLGFLAGFARACGVLLGTSAVDATGRWVWRSWPRSLSTAVVVERIRCRSSVAAILRRLGLGRPAGGRSPLPSSCPGSCCWCSRPTAAVSGTAVALRPDWPWLLIGVFAFHGLAEELVWRGYAFRRLREGRSFWAAACGRCR